MPDMPAMTEAQALELAERLRREAEERGLPYAGFYFTYMGGHFAAAVSDRDRVRPERASPFVYAMQ